MKVAVKRQITTYRDLRRRHEPRRKWLLLTPEIETQTAKKLRSQSRMGIAKSFCLVRQKHGRAVAFDNLAEGKCSWSVLWTRKRQISGVSALHESCLPPRLGRAAQRSVLRTLPAGRKQQPGKQGAVLGRTQIIRGSEKELVADLFEIFECSEPRSNQQIDDCHINSFNSSPGHVQFPKGCQVFPAGRV